VGSNTTYEVWVKADGEYPHADADTVAACLREALLWVTSG
jgi:hypothetical protein